MGIDQLRVCDEGHMMRCSVLRLESNQHNVALKDIWYRDHGRDIGPTHPSFPPIPRAAPHTIPKHRPLPPPQRKQPYHDQRIGDTERALGSAPNLMPPSPPSRPPLHGRHRRDETSPQLREPQPGRAPQPLQQTRGLDEVVSIGVGGGGGGGAGRRIKGTAPVVHMCVTHRRLFWLTGDNSANNDNTVPRRMIQQRFSLRRRGAVVEELSEV